MEDKDIKDGIERYIGKEKLFDHQFRNQLLSNVGKTKKRHRGITLINKFMPAVVLLLLVLGGITYFFLANESVDNLTTANKGKNETSEITFDVESHGEAFPELQSDINAVLKSLSATLTDSVKAVSINGEGTVVVDLKDFRQDLGSLTTNEKGEFLWPLYDTVFKYPQVKEVYFTFESSFTEWYTWLESTPDPMVRQTEQVPDNTSRLVDALITNHTYYNDMYQFIQESNLPGEGAGNVLVLYLEALKNGDVEKVSEYSINNDMNQIETLVSIYEQIDYDSLYIDTIIPSQGEPIYDVHLKFNHKDGQSGTRVLFMQFYDNKISIYDAPEN
ncbi:hypothetical protein [Paenisporosarcina indica]|uniref:hypothetical protein n=1 Tax=Paenisporosarcina indica TaxID=650093 RepID=UPI00094F60EF|nr:hypothetical protein [Paenisporosarcina indica]